MQYQLRIYSVKPGALDAWVAEWSAHVLPLRQAGGLEVLGPWITRDDQRFVWILGHERFAQADAAYYASDERRALDPDPARHLAATQAWLMDPASVTGNAAPQTSRRGEILGSGAGSRRREAR